MSKSAASGSNTKKTYDYADPKYGVTKGSARYSPEEWQRFEQLCMRTGLSPTTQIRKLVREFTDGRLVELSDLKPETLGEVQRHAHDMGLELRHVVAQIIAEWVAERRRVRQRK
jgi:hypothetical protein